jgi:hypothetical protein
MDKIDCKYLQNHDYFKKNANLNENNNIKILPTKRTVSNNYDGGKS